MYRDYYEIDGDFTELVHRNADNLTIYYDGKLWKGIMVMKNGAQIHSGYFTEPNKVLSALGSFFREYKERIQNE